MCYDSSTVRNKSHFCKLPVRNWNRKAGQLERLAAFLCIPKTAPKEINK